MMRIRLGRQDGTIPEARQRSCRGLARRNLTRFARPSGLDQAGDTIVEVLIAIGIISLVITAAYVTANRSYLTMQDAQERGNALKLVERQVEALKAYSTDNGSVLTTKLSSGVPFCMSLIADTPGLANNVTVGGSNPCVFAPDATEAPANSEPAYSVVISKSSTDTIGSGTLYVVQAKWDSVLGDGQNTIQMEYGVY